MAQPFVPSLPIDRVSSESQDGGSDGSVPSVADPGLTGEGQVQGRNHAGVGQSESGLRTGKRSFSPGSGEGLAGGGEEAGIPGGQLASD